jgi:hypothetical protein
MTSLVKLLDDFVCSIANAMTYAPDSYPAWRTYEDHMADLNDLWSKIQPRLKRDIEQAHFVDVKLKEMFKAFDAKDKEKGCAAACEIYNSKVEKFR